MRSLVVRKVVRNSTRQRIAQSPMVMLQPYCLSWPRANFATNGTVKPPTINCAALTETKR